MDVAAADAFATKKLRQVPRLNKKVQDARVIHDYKGRGTRVDAVLAAAQARLAQLQQAAAAPASSITAEAVASQSPSSALHSIKSSGNGAAGDVPKEANCKQQTRQDSQHAGASSGVQTDANSGAAGANSRPTAIQPPAAGSASAVSSAAVNPPLIFPARATVGRLATAALPACSANNTKATGGKNSSRSTMSSNAGSSAASSHRSRKSNSSTCSREQQQKQQQLAAADGILAQINDYMAAEISQADAAVQHLLALQQQQQAPAAHADKLIGSGNDCRQRRSSNGTIMSSNKCATDPGAALLSSADEAAAKAAALQALGIDSDSYTPELLASLAMRFQAFNLPPGLNSMPDLGTIALAVQQQEQEAARQRQQQQDEWLLQQQRQQLARQSAANRHLQLYQLGVMQQRARLQQGSSLVGPACVIAATYRSQQQSQSSVLQQQQQCGADCQGSTGREQQQQHQDVCASCDVGQGSLDKHVRFSSTGQEAAAAPAPADNGAVADGAQSPAAGAVPGAAPTAGTAPTAATASAEAEHAAAAAAAVVANAAATPWAAVAAQDKSTELCQAGSAPEHADVKPGQQLQQQQLTCKQPHQSTSSCCQAALAAPSSSNKDKDMNISALPAAALLQQQQLQVVPGQAGRPPQKRYTSDLPGAPAGASHGHLSPAGLTFNHLPGSRRQVYARIQDALAVSGAISKAEQSLRALTYAPSSRPAAAGSL